MGYIYIYMGCIYIVGSIVGDIYIYISHTIYIYIYPTLFHYERVGIKMLFWYDLPFWDIVLSRFINYKFDKDGACLSWLFKWMVCLAGIVFALNVHLK